MAFTYKLLNRQFLKRHAFYGSVALTTLSVLNINLNDDAICEEIPNHSLKSFQLKKELSPCSFTYPANNPIEDRFVLSTFKMNGSATNQKTTWEVGAVFDGHGGWQVADLASKKLIPDIMKNITVDDRTWWEYFQNVDHGLNQSQITSGIIDTFHQFDNYYIENVARNAYAAGYGGVASVGSCVCIAMLNREMKSLIVSNLGDCRAIVGTVSDDGIEVSGKGSSMGEATDAKSKSGWNAIQITSDHNARMPKEQDALRIAHPEETLEQLVRCVSSHACYVKGRLQLTRALGDLYLKNAEFNAKSGQHRSSGRHIPAPYNPPYVLNTPDVVHISLTANEKQLKMNKCNEKVVLLASDGVWDYMDPQYAVDALHTYLMGGLQYVKTYSSAQTLTDVEVQTCKVLIERLQRLLGVTDEELTSFSLQNTDFVRYEGLFREAYQYILKQAQHKNVDTELFGIESIAANVLGQITLDLAARESGLTIDTLKGLPEGGKRRSVHDDTTVVVMYI